MNALADFLQVIGIASVFMGALVLAELGHLALRHLSSRPPRKEKRHA